jgi:hypothetical protein
MDFLEAHKNGMEHFGFWSETYKEVIIKCIETGYKKEIIRLWRVSDFVSNGDNVLVKWSKRKFPLTDEELKEQYGKI